MAHISLSFVYLPAIKRIIGDKFNLQAKFLHFPPFSNLANPLQDSLLSESATAILGQYLIRYSHNLFHQILCLLRPPDFFVCPCKVLL